MSKPKKIRVRTLNRYTHYARIPADFFRDLGMKLNQELIIDKSVNPNNPLAWEIRIKPAEKSKK